jgi:hypothetical protein
LIVFFTVSLRGQSNRLYVAARNGLLVRSTPNDSGKIVGQLEFNEEIEITGLSNIDTINYRIATWCRLLYEGKVGYVFGGYLNKYPLPEEEFSSLRVYMSSLLKLNEAEFDYEYKNGGEKFDERNVYVEGSDKHLFINEFGFEWGVMELNLYDWEVYEVINLIELSKWDNENIEYQIFENSIKSNNLDKFEWINSFDDPEGIMVLEKRFPSGVRIIESSSL